MMNPAQGRYERFWHGLRLRSSSSVIGFETFFLLFYSSRHDESDKLLPILYSRVKIRREKYGVIFTFDKLNIFFFFLIRSIGIFKEYEFRDVPRNWGRGRYIENLYITINFFLFRQNISLKKYIFTAKKERLIKIDGIYMKMWEGKGDG